MAKQSKWRRREWVVPAVDGPLAGEVETITVRSLTTRNVDRARARSWIESRELFGAEHHDALLDRIAAGRKAGLNPDADAAEGPPKTDTLLCQSHGFYPPALVEYGLVAVGDDRLPDGSAERKDWADELPTEIAGYLARVVAVGVSADGDTNGLWDADTARPTVSAASSTGP